MTNWAGKLRLKLAQKAECFAHTHDVTYYKSLGKSAPTILFPGDLVNLRHGNFIGESYAAILENPTWAQRLKKAHSQRHSLPEDRRCDARELDSSNSSDALLMNCFCYPGAAARIFQSCLPSMPTGPVEFGVAGKVPLCNTKSDTTKLDMRAGKVIFEAKLTEADFTTKLRPIVERYRDLNTVFDVTLLPKTEDAYQGYQLIRNVLAAVAHGYSLCAYLRRSPTRSLRRMAASTWGHTGGRCSSAKSFLTLAGSGRRVSDPAAGIPACKVRPVGLGAKQNSHPVQGLTNPSLAREPLESRESLHSSVKLE